MPSKKEKSKIDEEIESWKGFPWALRAEDVEIWDAMMRRVKEQSERAVEESGKTFTTDAFFMAVILAQHKIIRRIEAKLKAVEKEWSAT